MYHPHHPRRTAFLVAALAALFWLSPAGAQSPFPAQTAVRPAGLPDPTAFRVQMETGNVSQAREWLAAGLDPNLLGDRIGSGLMIGAWEGNLPLMELFAARGADVNLANKLGETALMHAAWKGRIEAVRWLLARGARLERDAMQWTPLHYAVFAGHAEVAELLLDRGADINARSPNGSSVLMMAVYEGREDMARRLLARGADTSVKNENGDGALEWAMKFDHTRIARLVASPQAFRTAASRPKADWGQARKSEATTPEIEELLRIREVLATRNMSLDQVDRRIAAMRAKLARDSLKREAPPPAAAVLEITAERRAPARQEVRMLTIPAPR